MSKKIVLLGPPGCGKGTQSKLLVDNKNFFQLSTGDLLRAETSDNKSDVGQKIKQIMQQGGLVPDNFVIDIIVKKVSDLKYQNIIFDGFPRNIDQAKFLDKSLENETISLDHVIFFGIDYKVLESRIKHRIEQSSGEDLRTDDNLEVLNKRINIYKESTLPIVDYYKNRKILYEIDAMESIEAVHDNILKIIE